MSLRHKLPEGFIFMDPPWELGKDYLWSVCSWLGSRKGIIKLPKDFAVPPNAQIMFWLTKEDYPFIYDMEPTLKNLLQLPHVGLFMLCWLTQGFLEVGYKFTRYPSGSISLCKIIQPILAARSSLGDTWC